MFAFCFWQPVASRFLTQMLCCISAAVGLSCLAVPLRAQHRTVTVVQTGQQAPDGNGVFSGSPNFFNVNDLGQLAFAIDLAETSGTADNRGVFVSSLDGVTQIVRSGQIFSGDLIWFSSFSAPILNNSNDVLVRGSLASPSGAAGTGVFLGNSDGIQTIARTGQATPNGNTVFSEVAGFGFNDSGQASFRASVTDPSGQLAYSGIFRGTVDAVQEIVRTGQSAPDSNGSFSGFSTSTRGLNSLGQVSFQGTLDGTSGGDTDRSGIFIGDGENIYQIARSGQAVPDGSGFFSSSQLQATDFNDMGQVLFQARIIDSLGATESSRGLFLGTTDSITSLFRDGQSLANEDRFIRMTGFGNSRVNNAGLVVARMDLSDTADGDVTGRAVMVSNGEKMKVIARSGQVVPGNTGTFEDFSSQLMRVNDSGQVVFRAFLDTSGNGNSDTSGIFTGDGIDLIEVVRVGDAFLGSTVSNSGVLLSRSINKHGQIAHGVDLADGRRLLNLWTPDLRWRNEAGGSWETAGAWTLSLSPAHVHDVFINPDNNLTITGPASDTVLRSLQLGGGAGEATLHLTSGVNLTATDGLTIADNGVLTGQGTITGDVTSFGTIRPGDSAGSLSFDGNLILESTSNLFIELGGFLDGEYDKFVVSGDLNLNGNLSVDLIDGHSLWFNQQYLIGEVGGSLAGQFFGLSEGDIVGNFGGMDLFISYSMGSGNSVGLFTAVPEPSSASLIVTAVSLFAFGRRRRHTVS